MEVKQIAVIGCGASGLVAAKEVIDNGMKPTIFEKELELGGVWNSFSGAVWNTMHTNVSRYCVAFGDTPQPEDIEMFPHNSKVFEYLKNYAEKWNLVSRIKFGAKVTKVREVERKNGHEVSKPMKPGHGGWLLEWEDQEGGKQNMEFGGLIVATGIFALPSFPKIKGLETFTGKILHSRNYKSSSDFDGLRVLTIGGSVSGPEIASDIARNSAVKESIHYFRRPIWILKRFLPIVKESISVDDYSHHDHHNREGKVPVDLVLRTRQFDSQKKELKETDLNKTFNEYLKTTFCQDQQKVESIAVPQDEATLSTSVTITISDDYVDLVHSGKIKVRREPIQEVNGKCIIYTNGEIDEVDAIIMGTGYRTDNNFFSKDVLEKLAYDQDDITIPLILFNGTVHPSISHLFFIGLAKPPFFITMEQQARWAARTLCGKIELPPESEMREGLHKAMTVRSMGLNPQFPYGDCVSLTDKIARCGHSLPDINDLKLTDGNIDATREEIYSHFSTQPVIAAHYNFLHKPNEAIKLMRNVQRSIEKQFFFN